MAFSVANAVGERAASLENASDGVPLYCIWIIVSWFSIIIMYISYINTTRGSGPIWKRPPSMRRSPRLCPPLATTVLDLIDF